LESNSATNTLFLASNKKKIFKKLDSKPKHA
jgi:hypothetical protein